MSKVNDAEYYEGLLAEFAALRNEIVYNHGARLAVLTVCILLSSGLIAFGFENKNEYAFVVALVIIPSLMAFLETLQTSTFRIATYIQSRMEGTIPGMAWQTMLERWYMEHKGTRGWAMRYFLPLVLPYDALASLCVLGGYKFMSSAVTGGAIAVLVLFLIYMNWNLFKRGLPDVRKAYKDFFDNLKVAG